MSEREECCEKHERGRRCGDCPHDDRLVDHLGGNPALREELMGRLTSLRARVARLEGYMKEVLEVAEFTRMDWDEAAQTVRDIAREALAPDAARKEGV